MIKKTIFFQGALLFFSQTLLLSRSWWCVSVFFFFGECLDVLFFAPIDYFVFSEKPLVLILILPLACYYYCFFFCSGGAVYFVLSSGLPSSELKIHVARRWWVWDVHPFSTCSCWKLFLVHGEPATWALNSIKKNLEQVNQVETFLKT